MTSLKTSTVPDMVAQTFNPITRGAEVGNLQVWGQPDLPLISGQPQLHREILSQSGGVWCGEEECHGTFRVYIRVHIRVKSGELHMLGHVAREMFSTI